jgi:hypothetical protein
MRVKYGNEPLYNDDYDQNDQCETEYQERYERLDSSKYDIYRENQYQYRGRSKDRESQSDEAYSESDNDLTSEASRYEDDYYSEMAKKKKRREKINRSKNKEYERSVPTIQVNTSTEQPYLQSFSMVQFNHDGTISWEEFERQVRNRTKGRPGHVRAEMLLSALGPRVSNWYHSNEEVWKLSFEEQLATLRENYAARRRCADNVGIPVAFPMKIGEDIDDYVQQVKRACVHLFPPTFRKNPEETEYEQRKRRLEHHTNRSIYDRVSRDLFIQGLPAPLQRKCRSKDENLKTINDAVQLVKDYEARERSVQACEKHNKQLLVASYQQDRAVTYAARPSDELTEENELAQYFAQTMAAQVNSPRNVEQTEVGTIKKLLTENQKNTDKYIHALFVNQTEKFNELDKKLTRVENTAGQARNEQKSAKEKRGSYGAVKAFLMDMEEQFPEKFKKMMIEDTKPSAKAGTKKDPTLEQVEEERDARRPRKKCKSCGKLGHWVEECWQLQNKRAPTMPSATVALSVPAEAPNIHHMIPNPMYYPMANYAGYPAIPLGYPMLPPQQNGEDNAGNSRNDSNKNQKGLNANNANQNNNRGGSFNNNRRRKNREGNEENNNSEPEKEAQSSGNKKKAKADTILGKTELDEWKEFEALTKRVQGNLTALSQFQVTHQSKN